MENKENTGETPTSESDSALERLSRMNTLKNWLLWGFVIATLLALPAIYKLAKYTLTTTAG